MKVTNEELKELLASLKEGETLIIDDNGVRKENKYES